MCKNESGIEAWIEENLLTRSHCRARICVLEGKLNLVLLAFWDVSLKVKCDDSLELSEVKMM